jgi:hypothetical protein
MHIRSIAFAGVALAALALAVFSSGAQAVSVTFGNQEGGLIPSSPEIRNQDFRSAVGQAAIEHCAWYNKVAYLTGVVPGYGNYISFTCRFPRGYDPVKAGGSFWSRH